MDDLINAIPGTAPRFKAEDAALHADLAARLNQFHHDYDHPYREHIVELLNTLSRTIQVVFGPKGGDVVQHFHEPAKSARRSAPIRRYTAADVVDLPITRTLRELYAYAYFGLILDEAGEPMRLHPMESYWSPHFPTIGRILNVAGSDWSGREPLEAAGDIACIRLVIDGLIREPALSSGGPQPFRILDAVSPVSLAKLGGVSIATMRNLLNPLGSNRLRLDPTGRIPVAEARRWLLGHSGYRASVWQLACDDAA